jgi:hypothetical protein
MARKNKQLGDHTATLGAESEEQTAAHSDAVGKLNPGDDASAVDVVGRGRTADAQNQASPTLHPAAPPAKQQTNLTPSARFVAVWNVKARGRYYKPGTPLPHDALTTEMAPQLQKCGAITLLETTTT